MDTLDQVDLTDTYKIFHPSTAQYIPFISPWNILQTPNTRNLKELPVLGQIIWNKTRIQQKRKLWNTWRLKTLLNKQWVIEEQGVGASQKVPRM
jgi:hypothetical protein